jgi:uncharacterized protein YbjT (DUF2867 family)
MLSAFGVGDSLAKASWLAGLAYRHVLAGVFADKARGEATLRSSDLDWTIAYPVTLTNKKGIGRYRASVLEQTGKVSGMRKSRA